jgi:DNA-binding GntR family transcriptional regulator
MIHRHPDRIAQANREHRDILDAVRNHDLKRAKAISLDHLEHTLAIGSDLEKSGDGSNGTSPKNR